MKSANQVVKIRTPLARRDAAELAFLPAALEIVETPPSPASRMIATTIISLFCLALGWACFSKIDVEASAPGKIVPTGRSKYIQPFQIGVVRAIYVHDGEIVTAGQTLVELDPTLNDADFKHAQADLTAMQLIIARINAALSPDPLTAFVPPDGADPVMVASQRQFLQELVDEQRDKIEVLDRQKAQKEADRATVLATMGKDNALIPVLQQEVDVRQVLYQHETGSKLNYLDSLQQLLLTQKDLPIQESNLVSAEQAIAALVATRSQNEEEYRRTLLTSLADAQSKAADAAQDVAKAKELQKRQVMVAPVDGQVQQLAVHTVGGVVTPAQPLMVIVPSDSHLEIEAMVSNHDIGFIHPGQEAQIKVDTFDFTRFGLLHGTITTVSRDSVTQGGSSGNSSQSGNGGSSGTDPGQPAQVGSGSAQDANAVYSAHVALDKTQMMINDRMADLEPGMAVTVEIKTGRRRVISYLLSPLFRYSQDTLRER